MKIKDVMADRIVAVSQHEPVSSAARLMQRHNLGVLPVCDDAGNLRGILTDRDIVVRCIAGDMDPTDTKIREIMTRGLCTCAMEDDLTAALQAMGQSQIRRLPVVQEGKLMGMVSLGDLARSSGYSMEAAEALSEISSNVQKR